MDVAWAHSLSTYIVLHCPETPSEHGYWDQVPDGTEVIDIDTVTFPRPSWAVHRFNADNRFVRLPIARQSFFPTNLTVSRADGEVAQIWARSVDDPTLEQHWADSITL